MIFKQLFEPDSCTYTYLIACSETKQAVLIDPVLDTVERDIKVLQALDLTLVMTIETHVHADHLTGAKVLRNRLKSKIAYPAIADASCRDIAIEEGHAIEFGSITLHPLHTPGHTADDHCYLLETPMQKVVFTGDTLLIEACGRTDFQAGNAETLYHSIQNKIFNLPDETLVYPGHDYEGRQVTTIGQEKNRNPRLGNNKSLNEFVEIMNNLNLSNPRKIAFAVPGNRLCGECPDNVPEEYNKPCALHDQG